MEGYTSLKDYYTQVRFGAESQGEQITSLQQAADDSISEGPRLVVVHSPYPERSHKKAPRPGEETDSTYWGRGVGRTALLEAFEERLEGDKRYEVLHFLNYRDVLAGR